MSVSFGACLNAAVLNSVGVSLTLPLILTLLCALVVTFSKRLRGVCFGVGIGKRFSFVWSRKSQRFFLGVAAILLSFLWLVAFSSNDFSKLQILFQDSIVNSGELRLLQSSEKDLKTPFLDGVEMTKVACVAPSELVESRAYAPDPARQGETKSRAAFVVPKVDSFPRGEVAPVPLSSVARSLESHAIPNAAATSQAYAPESLDSVGTSVSKAVSGLNTATKSVLDAFSPTRGLLPVCFASKGFDTRISSVGYAGRESSVNASQIGVSNSPSLLSGGERSILEVLEEEKARISDEVRPAALTINVKKRTPSGGYEEAHGSGFAVQYIGRIFVLTNEHVVCGASCAEIDITTCEGETFRPIRVLNCSKFDVSALEIDPQIVAGLSNLKLCRLANSSNLRAGSVVFTIGAPLFMDWTLTYCNVGRLYSSVPELKEAGIIKVDETVGGGDGQSDLRDLVRYIQVSGVILEGNSGGPLFNVRGEVVGMVTATIQRHSVTTGIGFAIPVEDVLCVVRNMVDAGLWERSYFGVTIDGTTSSEFVKSKGVRLSEVIPNSPADRAGVKVDDCVLSFNGERVATRYDLARLIALTKPGEEGQMEVMRNGRQTSIVFSTQASSSISSSKSSMKPSGATIRR